jgi:chromosome segregation ATPase
MTDRLNQIEIRLDELETENANLRAEVEELRSLRDYVHDRVEGALAQVRDVRAYQNHVARTMSRMMARAFRRVNAIQRDYIDTTSRLNNHDIAMKNLAMAQATLVQNMKGESDSKLMELPPIKSDPQGTN